MALFDLEKHFAFYGAYHGNPINIFIHMIFVWPIFFTALVLLSFTPSLIQLPPQITELLNPFVGNLVLNSGFFLTLFYALFYVCLDVKAGSLAAVLCFMCWVGSSCLAKQLGYSLAWKVVLAAQLFCWTGQFVGHGVFEKRAPALLDNLSQAFLMAPFFVLFEALQFCGYEPYPGFHSRVQTQIDSNVNEWKSKKNKKIT
ncbi:hypothetical protein GIB67_011968 [Kingdonia uniflora]|uniref:YGL010w-like protein n=1 Tax=Kingdonia uniflora TaxID=39325 RepID=A0A7J7M000_9MAGN|nr:hypothetical protein GIB67_011968 [Kingdonia uniflora]